MVALALWGLVAVAPAHGWAQFESAVSSDNGLKPVQRAEALRKALEELLLTEPETVAKRWMELPVTARRLALKEPIRRRNDDRRVELALALALLGQIDEARRIPVEASDDLAVWLLDHHLRGLNFPPEEVSAAILDRPDWNPVRSLAAVSASGEWAWLLRHRLEVMIREKSALSDVAREKLESLSEPDSVPDGPVPSTPESRPAVFQELPLTARLDRTQRREEAYCGNAEWFPLLKDENERRTSMLAITNPFQRGKRPPGLWLLTQETGGPREVLHLGNSLGWQPGPVSVKPLVDQGWLQFAAVAPDRWVRSQREFLVRVSLEELRRDTDGDGLTDRFEETLLLDPTSSDTDGDGTADGEDRMPRTAQQSLRSGPLDDFFTAERGHTTFVIAPTSLLASIQPSGRVVQVSAEQAASRGLSATHYRVWFSRDRSACLVEVGLLRVWFRQGPNGRWSQTASAQKPICGMEPD